MAFVHTFIPLTYVVPLLRRLPQKQYIKPNVKFRMYDAENIFELLNYHDYKLTVDGLLEIPKQGAFEEA